MKEETGTRCFYEGYDDGGGVYHMLDVTDTAGADIYSSDGTT
jgi:hypothetical protein